MKKELPYTKTSDAIVGYEQSQLAKTESNDCVVRAWASAFELPYENAHKIIEEQFQRKFKKGTMRFNSKMNQLSKMRALYNDKYLKILGEQTLSGLSYSLAYDVKVKGVTKKRKMTVGTFAKKYGTGTYIISIRGHAFTMKNGVVIGNQNDAKRLKAVIEQAWEVVKF